jgi:hypothetical protein
MTHPQTDGSREAQRRAFYDRLEISDLFEADHIEASSVLAGALDAGRDLRLRLETADADGLRPEIVDWEDRTARRVEAVRGQMDAESLRYDWTAETGRAGQMEQLDRQLYMLTGWVQDERKRAGERAKDRFR